MIQMQNIITIILGSLGGIVYAFSMLTIKYIFSSPSKFLFHMGMMLLRLIGFALYLYLLLKYQSKHSILIIGPFLISYVITLLILHKKNKI